MEEASKITLTPALSGMLWTKWLEKNYNHTPGAGFTNLLNNSLSSGKNRNYSVHSFKKWPKSCKKEFPVKNCV